MGGTPRVLIATTNQGKLRELVPLLADCGHLLVPLAELGVDTDVPETGSTFEENATVKATAYAQMTGMLTLAEDSGLEIDALGGEPGVLSSRFAGEATPYDRKISLLLQKLKGVEDSKPELPISSCLDPSNAPSSTRAIVVSLTDAVNHPIKLTKPSLGVVS